MDKNLTFLLVLGNIVLNKRKKIMTQITLPTTSFLMPYVKTNAEVVVN